MKRAIPLILLTAALAISLGISLKGVRAQSDCYLNCGSCNVFETPHFIRVGATCAKAKQKAANAASAAAYCTPPDIVCGLTQVFVTYQCFPHPVSGQTAAEAFARYPCLDCVFECP